MLRKFVSILVESSPAPTLKLVKEDRKRPFLMLVEWSSHSQVSKTKAMPGQGQLTAGRDPRWATQRDAIPVKKTRLPSATIMTGNNMQLHKGIAYHQREASKSRSSSSYWWRLSKPKTSLWGTWTSTPSKSSVRKWSRTPIDSTARISSTRRTFQPTRHLTQNPCKFSFRVSSSLFEKAQTWW